MFAGFEDLSGRMETLEQEITPIGSGKLGLAG